jgi:hypothetical protein
MILSCCKDVAYDPREWHLNWFIFLNHLLYLLFSCTIARQAIRADLGFYHYLSVTAIGGFCDGIHGVIQGIAGGDNGT